MPDFTQDFQKALDHRNEHDCPAHPYAHYSRLYEIVAKESPKQVLEWGTATGFTTLVMCKAAPGAQIDTIEMELDHVELAKQNLTAYPQVNFIIGEGLKVIVDIPDFTYDLIFFDGFAPYIELAFAFERLIKSGGMLISANGFLKSGTSEKYLQRLGDTEIWTHVESFEDTVVYRQK